MGLHPLSRCDYAPTQKSTPYYPKLPNPDPNNFKVLLVAEAGKFIVARVKYPDCTNYEGEKILVFRGVTMQQVRQAYRLDPHFCNDGHISPFARFEPTADGWNAAIKLGWMLS